MTFIVEALKYRKKDWFYFLAIPFDISFLNSAPDKWRQEQDSWAAKQMWHKFLPWWWSFCQHSATFWWEDLHSCCSVPGLFTDRPYYHLLFGRPPQQVSQYIIFFLWVVSFNYFVMKFKTDYSILFWDYNSQKLGSKQFIIYLFSNFFTNTKSIDPLLPKESF